MRRFLVGEIDTKNVEIFEESEIRDIILGLRRAATFGIPDSDEKERFSMLADYLEMMVGDDANKRTPTWVERWD